MRLWRFCVAALLYDWLVFVAQTVWNIRAVELDASATHLGLLRALSSAVYVFGSLYVGRLADRGRTSTLARIGTAGGALACAWLTRSSSLGWIFVGAPMLSLAATLFWPSVQSALGREMDPARIERGLGVFNVMWSLGKTLGFATGGELIAGQGYQTTLWMAAASAVPILMFLPRESESRRADAPAEGHPRRAVFRTMGYVANFIGFGVGAAFEVHFFKYLGSGVPMTLWDPKRFFGYFLGTIYLSQTLAFVLLQRNSAWTYRRTPLYLSQMLTAAAAAAMTLVGSDRLMLAVAPLVGASLGFAYASSIYYSLHGPSQHGKYSGIHEAVLGAGNFLVPLVGGWLADRVHELRVPYWLAAASALAAIGIEEVLYRRSVKSSSNPSIR